MEIFIYLFFSMITTSPLFFIYYEIETLLWRSGTSLCKEGEEVTD